MKNLLMGVLILGTSNVFASSSITGIGSYGSWRSFGPETIIAITKEIEHVCLIERGGKLESKVECIKLQDSNIFRICSATCNKGSNLFITNDGQIIQKTKK